MKPSPDLHRFARWIFLLGLGPVAALAGCHSRFVEATLENQSPAAIRLVEVDYPSASFGVQSLAAGGQYHYRFKIQGSGEVKILFTDAKGKAHAATGPELKDGQEGTLRISVDAGNEVQFEPRMSVR